MSTDKFFSKTHIYPTMWTIIVGLLAFLGGHFWKSITGPDEVVVLHRDNSKDTTVTVIQFKPDQDYFEELNKLTSKTVKKQFLTNHPQEKKKNIDSLTINIAKEYQLKFDSLRLSLTKSYVPQINDKIISAPNTVSDPNKSRIKRPKFKLPKIVEGYTESKLNSFACVILNKTEFNRKEKVIINLDFFNKAFLDKITPVFVDIVEPKSPNNVYEIWSEQYEINEINNIISFSADFKPGKYNLTIGFYHLEELNTKYPTLYSSKFNIEIK